MPFILKRSGLLTLVALMALAVIVSLPVLPTLTIQPRDSGIFAYFASETLAGATPYKDVFEHKAPVVFLMDMVAFVLFGPNRWAIWLITTLNTLACGAAFFALASRLTSHRAAVWVGTVCFVITARHPALAHDGNFTEPYALLPALLCLLIGHEFLRAPGYRWALLIGLTAGWLFMTRQTAIGGPLTLVPAILLAQRALLRQRGWWRWLGAMIAGGLIAGGAVFVYLLAEGAFSEGFVAIWTFNLVYTRAAEVSFAQSVINGLENGPVVRILWPVAPLTVWGVVVVARRAWTQHRERESSADPALVTMGVWMTLSLLTNLLLANTSRHDSEHYYIVVLPEMMLLATMALDAAPRRRARRANLARFGAGVYFVTIVVLTFVAGTFDSFLNANGPILGDYAPHPVAAYIAEHTAPDDRVYVWSRSGAINFQARRRNPVRHFMGYHLLYPDYAQGKITRQELARLTAAQPVMVVDMSALDELPPIARNIDTAQWGDIHYMSAIFDFVLDHCRPDLDAPFETVVIYRCDYNG